MSLLILECVPKKWKAREGLALYHFLKLPVGTDIDVKLVEFRTKTEFLKFLSKEKNLSQFQFVHLSGHGSIHKHVGVFELPYGDVLPQEFPKACFEGQCITLSACELGKSDFSGPFIQQTLPEFVIGPSRDVTFDDAIIFWVNFYFFVLYRDFKATTAFDKTRGFLAPHIKGGFSYWKMEE